MKLSDMLFANAMMGDGGGGGGGDLPIKTAQVTLATTDRYISLYNSYDENNQYTSIYLFDDNTFRVEIDIPAHSDPVTATLLWVGTDSVTLQEAYGARVSETGDVSYDAETNQFTIWGNCTITLSSID
jgi:hypothetical protein